MPMPLTNPAAPEPASVLTTLVKAGTTPWRAPPICVPTGGGVTDSTTALEVIPPLLAVMLVEPTARAVTSPVVLTVATVVPLDTQVNAPNEAAVASVNTPVAANCCVLPTIMLGVKGVIARLTKAGAVTFKVTALEVTPFVVAVTLVTPCAKLLAIPLVFNAATVGLLDTHVTAPEIFPAVPSEYVPVAVKVTGSPFAIEGAVGVMLMLLITAAVTAAPTAGAVMPANDAETVVLPSATPVAIPVVLPIVATAGFAETHVT